VTARKDLHHAPEPQGASMGQFGTVRDELLTAMKKLFRSWPIRALHERTTARRWYRGSGVHRPDPSGAAFSR
jgi:hypothetical protein